MNSAYSVTIKNGQSTATIPIEYERKRRRRLVLRVYPRTARVVFSVPLHTPEDYAADFLQKHLPWLEKQLQKVLPFCRPGILICPGTLFITSGGLCRWCACRAQKTGRRL
jgi:hypothetical protein